MAEILVDEQYVSGLKDKISMLRRKVSELEGQVRSVEEERDHAQFRITHELEPRIQQEKRSYDAYVSQSTGERECEWFEKRIEEICDFVKEHRECFEWEECDGDFLQMILYLILNKEDIDLLYIDYIEEKEGVETNE